MSEHLEQLRTKVECFLELGTIENTANLHVLLKELLRDAEDLDRVRVEAERDAEREQKRREQEARKDRRLRDEWERGMEEFTVKIKGREKDIWLSHLTLNGHVPIYCVEGWCKETYPNREFVCHGGWNDEDIHRLSQLLNLSQETQLKVHRRCTVMYDGMRMHIYDHTPMIAIGQRAKCDLCSYRVLRHDETWGYCDHRWREWRWGEYHTSPYGLRVNVRFLACAECAKKYRLYADGDPVYSNSKVSRHWTPEFKRRLQSCVEVERARRAEERRSQAELKRLRKLSALASRARNALRRRNLEALPSLARAFKRAATSPAS